MIITNCSEYTAVISLQSYESHACHENMNPTPAMKKIVKDHDCVQPWWLSNIVDYKYSLVFLQG